MIADAGSTSDAGTTDAGSGAVADAGSTSDAGTTDAGSGTDGGPTSDGGPAAAIESVPCPADPKVLWSRTFTDEVDFRGVAGDDGSLYWIEYDPPPTFLDPAAPAWVASADADGHDRFRVKTTLTYPVDAHLIAAGMLVVAKGAIVAAFDAASGAPSWSLDLSRTYTDGYAQSQGIADLGEGKIALAMYDYNVASGLYVVDAAKGAILWSTVGSADTGYHVQGSDGAGDALATANYTSSYSPEQGYHNAQDVFAVDSSGHELWRHHIVDGGALLAWPAGAPWIVVPGGSSATDYVQVPGSWFAAVSGGELGFAVQFGAAAASPNVLEVVRDGVVVASGAMQGTNPYDGTAVFPFLAGDRGDHAVLVAQRWPGNPGLCHPARAAEAAIHRFDSSSSWTCPFSFEGESGIVGAALLPGRIVLGRRTFLTDACTHEVQPVTLEAYALPGESLAPVGWVQRGGSPGMGLRQRR